MTSSAPNIPERYEILSELGSGGMGSVYKVHDSTLDKTFALKVLKFSGRTAGSEIIRFQKEAKAAASLQHDNIMQTIDFGFHEKTTPYMVLEYVEGETLQQRIKEKRSLSLVEAAEIFEQTARALSFAHSRNIIHRDLKSSNILLTKGADGKTLVKLFDFGIARVLEEPAAMKLTAPDAIIGTPKYMSPEQASGKKADARSDIYALGCVMFETLTGKSPFNADSTLALLDMQINLEAPKLGAIKGQFKESPIEKMIDRCLQKDPANRFQTADDVLEFLSSPPAESESAVAPAVITTRKKPWKVIAVVGATLVGAGLLVFVSAQLTKPKETVSQKILPATQTKPVSSAPAEKIVNWTIQNSTKVPTVHLKDDHFEDSNGDLSGIPRTVRELDISNIPPTPELFDEIAKLDFLTDIKMDYMEVPSGQLAKLKSLHLLRFISARGATFKNMEEIRLLGTVQDLVLPGLSPTQIECLSGLPKLSKLSLIPEPPVNVPLSREVITALSHLKALKTLKIVRGNPVETTALPLFSSMNKLEYLSIIHTNTIAQGIPNLAKLKVGRLELRDDGLKEEHIQQLAAMTTLTQLDISGNPGLKDKALEYLYAAPNLKSLKIFDSQFSQRAVNLLKKNRVDLHVEYGQSFDDLADDLKGITDSL